MSNLPPPAAGRDACASTRWPSSRWLTAACAPAARTTARPSAVPAVPTTWQPLATASCTAARPTAPDAPCTKILSPALAEQREKRARYAVAHGTPTHAPCTKLTASGRGRTCSTSHRASSAYVPLTEPVVYTLLPTGGAPNVPPPTAATMPAPSLPGVRGSVGRRCGVAQPTGPQANIRI
eukprot:1592046-Prymnesium_polylepis.1